MNEGIELKVYRHNAPNTYVDTLVGRRNPRYLDELGVGAGSFEILADDPQLLEDPTLLDYRNIIKVVVDNKVIGAWQILTKKTIIIHENERAEEGIRVAGKGLLSWFDDAVVEPLGGQDLESYDERWFNFATPAGIWYEELKPYWHPAVDAGTIYQQSWWKDSKALEKWPESAKHVRWVWDIQQPPHPAIGTVYFRHTFSTTSNQDIAMYLVGDNDVELFVDGALIATYEWAGTALRVPMILTEGNHVIGIKVTNNGGPAGVAFAMYKLDVNGNEVLWRWTDTNNQAHTKWECIGTEVPPAWSPGEIMSQLIIESFSRGVRFGNYLTPTYNASRDSNGQPWPRAVKLEWNFKVAKTHYSAVLQQLRELGVHSWINPDTYQFNMAMLVGTDRTADPNAVTFELGKNLKRAESDGTGVMKNTTLIKTKHGYIRHGNAESVQKYGNLEDGAEMNIGWQQAVELANQLFDSRGDPEEAATYEITTSHEMPYVDFFKGDVVLAPKENGLLVPRRVVSISVAESDTGRPIYTLEFDVISKSNQEKILAMVQKLSGGSATGGMASTGGVTTAVGRPVVVGPDNPQIEEVPQAPTNLSASSTGTWNASGTTPLSTVTLTWGPVTLTTQNNPMVAAGYRVWMRDNRDASNPWTEVAQVATTSTKITDLTPGVSYQFKVQALGVTSISSDSNAITHTASGPTTPMPAPTTPVLSTSRGLLDIKWDGLLNGNQPPPQFRYVFAKMSLTSGGTYTRVGTVLQRGGGTITVSGLTPGLTYWVKLVAVDGVGLASADSGAASLLVSGIDLADLDESVQGAIDAAAQVAYNLEDEFDDFYATDFTNLDLAFQNVETNVLPNLMNGSLLVNGAITSRHHQANSIFSQHVVIGSLQNIIPTGMGEARAPVSWAQGLAWDTAEAPDGMEGSYRSTKGQGTYIPPVDSWDVEPNSEYFMEIWLKADVPNSKFYIEMKNQDGGHGTTNKVPLGYTSGVDSQAVGSYPFGNGLVPTDWTRYTSQVTTLPTTTKLRVGNIYFNHSTGTERNAQVWVLMRLRPRTGPEMMVDGAILARHVGAKQIDTPHLRAGSVDAEIVKTRSLVAENLQFRTLTGDEMALGSLSVGHVNDTFGRDLVIDENERIIFAVGAAGDALDAATGVANDLQNMQMYYTFGDTGLEMSTPSSPISLWLTNEKLAIMQGGQSGVELSSWTAGQMIVNEFVGTTVTLGNHQLSQYPGGTVMRFVG